MILKKTKYKNKKILFENIKFDSQKELKRYCELKMLNKLGAIKNLILQPVFELQETFKKNGITHRAIKYIADFQYFDIEKHKIIIEDVKGFKTKDFIIKQKLFEYKFKNLELKLL